MVADELERAKYLQEALTLYGSKKFKDDKETSNFKHLLQKYQDGETDFVSVCQCFKKQPPENKFKIYAQKAFFKIFQIKNNSLFGSPFHLIDEITTSEDKLQQALDEYCKDPVEMATLKISR